jgi:two-component system CheB/CheR fusion protein
MSDAVTRPAADELTTEASETARPTCTRSRSQAAAVAAEPPLLAPPATFREVRAPQPEISLEEQMHYATLEVSPTAQLLVDAVGTVKVVNGQARELFGTREADVGRPLRDLQLSYPMELHPLIERAETGRCPVSIKEIEWRSHSGEVCWLDLHVAPLLDQAGSTTGTVLTFIDATAYHRLRQDLEKLHHELEIACRELQSTNEVLETINEELQTLNDELRIGGEDLKTSRAFFQSLLSNLRGGVADVAREASAISIRKRSTPDSPGRH